MVEDAVSGVEAGARGAFGLVVGVDRDGRAAALRHAGAHMVVSDLRSIPVEGPAIPSALAAFGTIAWRLRDRRAAVFLDYDGTLTPIVDRPERAVLSDAMRATVDVLATRCLVAIVSGRDRADVERLVGLADLHYAGSHGFDISGPRGFTMQHEEGASRIPELQRALAELRSRLEGVPGVLVEAKRYAIAVHYRLTPPDRVAEVAAAVDEVARRMTGLRKTGGKMIFELRPRLDWDKGKAVLWLLQALDLDGPDVLPFYLGDDETDEDAFRALRDRGIGIVVADERCRSFAAFGLRDPDEVCLFLSRLSDTITASAR